MQEASFGPYKTRCADSRVYDGEIKITGGGCNVRRILYAPKGWCGRILGNAVRRATKCNIGSTASRGTSLGDRDVSAVRNQQGGKVAM